MIPRDVLICAPTGSGKTIAFLLPIIQLLSTRKLSKLRALIILPGRDLANQLYTTLKALIKGTNLKASLLIGDSSLSQETDSLYYTVSDEVYMVDMAVCTPGRLFDHLHSSHRFDISQLRFLVVDEADRTLTESRQDWYNSLENKLYFEKNSKRNIPEMSFAYLADISGKVHLQKILASATLLHDPSTMKKFNMINPIVVMTTSSKSEVTEAGEMDSETAYINPNPESLKEILAVASEADKIRFLLHILLNQNGSLCFEGAHTEDSRPKVLIFTNKREGASDLCLFLKMVPRLEQLGVKLISCSFPVDKRARILGQFGSGQCSILVCTDAMARGIDIAQVDCVINYDLPQTDVTYIHRAGRTARSGHSGVAITFIEQSQGVLEWILVTMLLISRASAVDSELLDCSSSRISGFHIRLECQATRWDRRCSVELELPPSIYADPYEWKNLPLHGLTFTIAQKVLSQNREFLGYTPLQPHQIDVEAPAWLAQATRWTIANFSGHFKLPFHVRY
ncbi:ATP-dependent RNA helicase ddx51, partial [Cichlidogyrus casuarinus]